MWLRIQRRVVVASHAEALSGISTVCLVDPGMYISPKSAEGTGKQLMNGSKKSAHALPACLSVYLSTHTYVHANICSDIVYQDTYP